jgi:general secretion pathway protein B
MSLILDALNRSQAERGSEGHIPGIDTQHWVEPLPYTGRWQRGLPWLALCLALLVIVWLLFSRNGEPQEVAAKVSAPIAAQAPVEARLVSTQAKRVEPEISRVPNSVAAPVDDLAVSEREILQQSTGNSAAVADLYSATDASVALLPAAGTGSQAQAIEKSVARPRENEQAIDIAKMVNLARREAKNVQLSEHPTPFLAQLSQQIKDQVPTIYYTQHDYSSIAAQSSVILNGELVQLGGSVAGKIKLLEILPNSIVLSDRGTEFRLRALNSWINL